MITSFHVILPGNRTLIIPGRVFKGGKTSNTHQCCSVAVWLGQRVTVSTALDTVLKLPKATCRRKLCKLHKRCHLSLDSKLKFTQAISSPVAFS